MIALLATVMIWHGPGCWEDAHGNYVLVNTTERVNCQPVTTYFAESKVEAITVQRRDAAGLPVAEKLPPTIGDDE